MERPRPRPKDLGRVAGCSSLSDLSTLVHICLQTSSDIRGPGSPDPSSSDGVVVMMYRIIPTVLGRAYSFAMAPS